MEISTVISYGVKIMCMRVLYIWCQNSTSIEENDSLNLIINGIIQHNSLYGLMKTKTNIYIMSFLNAGHFLMNPKLTSRMDNGNCKEFHTVY